MRSGRGRRRAKRMRRRKKRTRVRHDYRIETRVHLFAVSLSFDLKSVPTEPTSRISYLAKGSLGEDFCGCDRLRQQECVYALLPPSKSR